MSVYKPQGADIFRFDFWRGGDRFHGSTGQTERRLAKEVERAEIRKAEALVASGRRKPKDVMTINVACDRYWKEQGQHTRSADETWENLSRLVRWIGKDTPIVEITDDTLSTLVARRRGDYRWGQKARGLVSAGQVNRSVTQLLRRIMTRARKIWKLPLPEEPNWTAHILTEPRERVREMTYEEEGRIENHERVDYRPARIFAQITGLRRREVVSLTWPQVDFDAEVLRVVGKGDKPHIIPITPDLHALLWPLRGHHPTHVFTYVCQRTRREVKSGRDLVKDARYPITYWGLGSRMRRTMDKAEVVDLRIHDLRHTSATRTLRATGNLKLVQKLLNHSTMRVTEKYAHASLDDLRDAMKTTAADDQRRKSRSQKQAKTVKISRAKD